MRILHCSDFHANPEWFGWLANSAGNYDVVCLTGDHLDLLNLQQINSQLSMIQGALRRVAVPVMLCSGNNDAYSGPPAPPELQHAAWLADLRRPGIWVDGDVLEVGGVRITCVGWNAGLPSATSDEIWLCHAPPARSWVSGDPWDGEAGDEILGEVCRAGAGPGLLLSGHQHHPQRHVCLVGRTWCLNPGYGTHPSVPDHIIVDTQLRTTVLRIPGRDDSVTHIK